MSEEKLFCKGGGCTAKLGAGILNHILENLPKTGKDANLLVGFDSRDDAAVYKLSDDLAVVQTLDFFPPMVDDPYIFGQIAAANALSDIYAMGGQVKTALNIVCFPEQMDLNILGEIMRGGSDKVAEAGGQLVGGHSIADSDVKYGLSVMGTVHPQKIYANNTAQAGDKLILTKKLGVGIVCTANRVGEASREAMTEAVNSMTALNKYAAEIMSAYDVHSCTDVTGFGFLGHLHEMLDGRLSAVISSSNIQTVQGAKAYAEEFLLTAAAQRNRNYLTPFVKFERVSFAMEEILFDPQTSGGLLIAVAGAEAEDLCGKLHQAGICADIVGEIKQRAAVEIYVQG